jgi:hypothetical protein
MLRADGADGKVMIATHHLHSTLVSLLVASCMTLAATGSAAAAVQPSTAKTQPTSHITERRHHPRVVAYADGTLKHHRQHRRHVVAYAD